jgi:glycerol-3-phosphate responsive antiterminator
MFIYNNHHHHTQFLFVTMVAGLKTAKNGAKYIIKPDGRAEFISGASKAYMAKIRKKRTTKAKEGGFLPQLALMAAPHLYKSIFG